MRASFCMGEGRGTPKRQFPAEANERIPKRVFTSGRDEPVTMDGRLCWPPKMGHSVLRAMCTDMPKGTRGNQCNSQNIMVDRIMMHSTERQLQRQLQSRWSKEIIFRRKRFPRQKPQEEIWVSLQSNNNNEIPSQLRYHSDLSIDSTHCFASLFCVVVLRQGRRCAARESWCVCSYSLDEQVHFCTCDAYVEDPKLALFSVNT